MALTLTLGQTLKITRVRARINQQQMADQLGVSRSAVSQYERGAATPSFATVIRWAELTHSSLDDFAQAATGRDSATTWSNASYHPDQMSLWAHGQPEAA